MSVKDNLPKKKKGNIKSTINLEGMIKMTNFDYPSFINLVDEVTPFCDLYTPHVYKKGGFIIRKKQTGRNRDINPTMLIGLVLTWSSQWQPLISSADVWN